MDGPYGELLEAAEIARDRGNLSDSVKIAMLARMHYAFGRGDISGQEYDTLTGILGTDFVNAHYETMCIALTGESDADVDAQIALEKAERVRIGAEAAA